MINRKIFSSRLIELRKSKNLTQQQLGIELGTIKQSINNWEKCVSIPSLDVVAILADYFNVSIDYLTGRTDCPDIVTKDKDGNFIIIEAMQPHKD